MPNMYSTEKIVCVISLILFFKLCVIEANLWCPPTTVDLVTSNGYPIQAYEIETEQGYILKIFRIPYGKTESERPKKGPLLLQHGLLCSSACWAIPDPSKGLVYRLADAGYDVWVNNDRGTIYSRKHKSFSSNSDEFWDFSFEEMGRYDLPSVIDYILKETGETQLTFVGHSQGTSQFFIMTSTRPEYNNKIRVATLLAPVAYLKGGKGLLPIIAKFFTPINFITEIFGIKHVLDRGFIEHILGHTVCKSFLHFLCDDVYFIISGFDSPQVNKTLGTMIPDHCPAGTSVKQLTHFSQFIKNGGKFTMFDYGKKRNVLKYTSEMPPEFDVTRVTAPIFLYYSSGDYLATEMGVEELLKVLPNKKAYKVPYDKFNHVDFMWAKDINKLLYDKLIEDIQ